MKKAKSFGVHILSFDVEHWDEGFSYRGFSRIKETTFFDEKTMHDLFGLLAETRQQATMFFTGRFAREFPHVVKQAALQGHEVASHSFTHKVLSRMGSLHAFREDLSASIKKLEDLCGKRIIGYRAPKWSIRDLGFVNSLRVLKEVGMEYDSSLFPRKKNDQAWPLQIDLGNGTKIWEIPAMTMAFMRGRIPVGGGLWFRLFPEWVTRAALLEKERLKMPGVIYLHPYDLDPDCPKGDITVPFFYMMRKYGVASAFRKLKTILQKFKFICIRDYLETF